MALTCTVTDRALVAPLKKRVHYGVMSTNNTTYAAGGLALPTKTELGFVRSLDSFVVLGNLDGNATEYVWTWNKATGKLQAFISNGASPALLAEGTAIATGTRTYQYVATGW